MLGGNRGPHLQASPQATPGKGRGAFSYGQVLVSLRGLLRVAPVSRARGRPDQPPLVGLRTIIHVLQVRNLRFKQSEW